MKRRLVSAILLLYPRRVREDHGREINALIADLVARDGRSPIRLLMRLAVDGLVQRLASTVTAWTLAAVLAGTCIGGLAASNLASASPFQREPRTPRTTAPGQLAPDCRPTRQAAPHFTMTRDETPHRPHGDPLRSRHRQLAAHDRCTH